jgi:hypothetical protein
MTNKVNMDWFELKVNGKYLAGMSTKVEEKALDMYTAVYRMAKKFKLTSRLELINAGEVIDSDKLIAGNRVKPVKAKGKK